MVKIKFLSLNVIIILVIALAHTFIHYSTFSDEDRGLNAGISGFSINEVKPEQAGTFSFSLLVIGFEWGALILVMLFSLTSSVKSEVKQGVKLKIDKEKMRNLSKGGTEIDMLYELLRSNRALKIKVIEKLFEVEKTKVMEWGHTLEQAGLAKINYPNMGGPEIIIR